MKSSASRSSAARQGANVQDGERDDAISIEPPVRLTGLARLTSETSSVSNSEANAGQEGIWTDRVEREAKLPAAPAERTRQEPSVPGAVSVPGINASSQEESRIGRGKMDVEAPAVPATPNPSQELSYTESRSTLSHEGVTSRQEDAGDLADEETAEVLTASEGTSGQGFPILAELAPNEEDVARRVTERLEAKLAKRVEREIMNRISAEQERQVITAAAVEVEDEDESDERICGMSRNCWYLFLLIAVCLTAGIVVAVMFVTKEEGEQIPIESPTPAPATKKGSDRFRDLVDLIGPLVTKDVGLFEDETTTEYMALKWIADEDQWNAMADIESTPTQIWVERYALVVFVLSTNGRRWGEQAGFLQPTSVCDWFNADFSYGVRCDELFVSNLFLGDLAVQGSIPSELALLTSTKTLDLNRNFLRGTIPSEILNMKDLVFLGLERNALTGSLSTELGSLTSLEVFSLASNSLSGVIPTEIGYLTSLQALILEQNNFSSSLPSELGHLTNLDWLSLYGNRFSGQVPREYSNLQFLETVYMDDTDLTGSLDEVFCGTRLFPVNELWADCFGDPPQISCSCCTDCCNVDGGNCVNGLTSTPSESRRFLALVEIIGPSLTSDLLPGTPQYEALKWIADSDEWGDDIEGLPAQAWIERYVIVLLYFIGNGASWTKQFNFLQPTSVCEWNDESGLEGVVCNGLYVEQLNMVGAGVSGTIPSELALLTSLVQLYFDNNLLSGKIPSEVFSLPNVYNFWFANNSLTGSIPTEIGYLSTLIWLDLDKNLLTGPVPTEIGAASDAILLQLYDNYLTGSLPSELSSLTSLVDFVITDNILTGTIPTEVGQMRSLRGLYLGINRMTGLLPSEIGLLSSSLIHLHLQNNAFEGQVPDEYSGLTNLDVVYLEYNALTGSLDNSFCSSRPNPIENMWADCTEVSCACCTTCCDSVICTEVN